MNEYSYKINLKTSEIFRLIIEQLSIKYTNIDNNAQSKNNPLLIRPFLKFTNLVSKPANSKYLQNPNLRLKIVIYFGLFFSAILLPFIYFSLVSSSSFKSEEISTQLITLLIYIPISIGSALLLGFIAIAMLPVVYTLILIILLVFTFGLIYIYLFIYYRSRGGESIIISKDNTIEIIGNKKNIIGEGIEIQKMKYFSFILIKNEENVIFTIPIRNKDIASDNELKDFLKYF